MPNNQPERSFAMNDQPNPAAPETNAPLRKREGCGHQHEGSVCSYPSETENVWAGEEMGYMPLTCKCVGFLAALGAAAEGKRTVTFELRTTRRLVGSGPSVYESVIRDQWDKPFWEGRESSLVRITTIEEVIETRDFGWSAARAPREEEG